MSKDTSKTLPSPEDSDPFSFAVAERDRSTVEMVRDALKAGRVTLAYQPVVAARAEGGAPTVAFHEGLVRLLDPQNRVIPAGRFMDTIETTELGRMIDVAALRVGLTALDRHPEPPAGRQHVGALHRLSGLVHPPPPPPVEERPEPWASG